MNHKPEKKDPALKRKIAAKIHFAAAMVMQALASMYQNGSLTESENRRKCVEEARKSADSVMAFVGDCLFAQKGSWLVRSTAYEEYSSCCEENGRKALGMVRFVPEMRRKGVRGSESSRHLQIP